MAEPVTITTPWLTPKAWTQVSSPQGSSVSWVGLPNTGVTDDVAARVDLGTAAPNTESRYLLATDFGFSLPINAVIEGFEVRIRARGNFGFIPAVQLRDAGTGISTSLGNWGLASPGAFQERVFGGPTYNPHQWPAPAVNSSIFGVRFLASAIFPGLPDVWVEVDSIEVRIHYHLPGEFELAGEIKGKGRLSHVIPPPPFEHTAFATNGTNEYVAPNGAWDNIPGAFTPDAQYATSRRISPAGSGTQHDTPTDYLNLTGFNLSIPSIATIKSIRLRIHRGLNDLDSTAKLTDHTISLLRDGARFGPNKKGSGLVPAAAFVAPYVWQGDDLAGFSRSDLLAPNFGASLQFYSTSDSPGNGRVRVYWTEIRVQWDIFAGTIANSLELATPCLSVVRQVQGGATAQSGASASLGVARALSGTAEATSAASSIGGGLWHDLSGAADGLSSAVGDLQLGIPHALAGTVSAALVLDEAPAHVVWGLAGTIKHQGKLLPSSLTLVSVASVAGFRRRFRELLPMSWFGDSHPVLDALLTGLVQTAIHGFQLVRFADMQARIRTASGGFLDLISGDFFGTTLPRREGEDDERFRERIRREIFRERATRQGLSKAIEDLVGTPPVIVEPQRPADTGAYSNGFLAYGVAGCWASRDLDYQAFVTVTLPSAVGIPFVGGYGSPVFGYSASPLAVWADSSPVEDAITAEDVYDVLERNKPAGTVLWVHVR